MLTALCKSISLFLYQNHIIDEEEVEICQYGFEISFSTVISFLVVISIAFLLRIPEIGLLYYTVFVVLRQFTGGYHADTYLSCNLTFGILSLLVLGIVKLIAIYPGLYLLEIHSVLIIFSFLVILFLAPVENKNKSLDTANKKKNHIFSIIFSIVLSISSFILYHHFLILTAMIGFTLFLVTMLILYSKTKERSKKT
ncbi:MAG: accessory gene regulator B family protein [Oscillospiraceae bacterium]|nr:accessory gene regulator B family protein [Oscillospiraceae bacterium]